MRAKTLLCALSFLLLGSNYLLPFNTMINSFSYLPAAHLPPARMIAILNFIYQLAAIGTNTLLTWRRLLFTGQELYLAYASISCVVASVIALSVLVGLQCTGWWLMLALCVSAAIQSGFSSLFDAMNVHYTQFFSSKSILLYSAGINISGTLHAVVIVLLKVSMHSLPSEHWIYVAYYAATALFLSGSYIVYRCLISPRVPFGPQAVEEDVRQSTGWRPAKWHIFLTLVNFIATLLIYPTMLVRTNLSSDFMLYYNEVCVFLLFNVSALIGNVTAVYRPMMQRAYLIAITILRCLVISPLLIVFHYLKMDSHLTIPLQIILTLLLGCTSGYTVSSLFSSAPATVHSIVAKVLVLRCLNLAVSYGLFVGSVLAMILHLMF